MAKEKVDFKGRRDDSPESKEEEDGLSLIETLDGLESSRNHFTVQRSVYPLSSRSFSLLEAQFLSERRLFNEAIAVLDSELVTKPNEIG